MNFMIKIYIEDTELKVPPNKSWDNCTGGVYCNNCDVVIK